jgi:HAE1 family hydrophobic/amphiphilic exporter-1
MGFPSIPELSVKRPVAVWMLFLGIMLLGGIAFKMLPVEMMPNVSFGDITINIDVRGGMPALEVEKRITKIVEEAVGSVTHLKDIIAISKEGNATITWNLSRARIWTSPILRSARNSTAYATNSRLK